MAMTDFADLMPTLSYRLIILTSEKNVPWLVEEDRAQYSLPIAVYGVFSALTGRSARAKGADEKKSAILPR
jgi:hypothetical protein